MIERMVLFGASGDLTSRLLMPAIAQLAEARRLRKRPFAGSCGAAFLGSGVALGQGCWRGRDARVSR